MVREMWARNCGLRANIFKKNTYFGGFNDQTCVYMCILKVIRNLLFHLSSLVLNILVRTIRLDKGMNELEKWIQIGMQELTFLFVATWSHMFKTKSAWAWCTGKTQRNRVEKQVGGVIGMGNTSNSMADSCQCMTKPTIIL